MVSSALQSENKTDVTSYLLDIGAWAHVEDSRTCSIEEMQVSPFDGISTARWYGLSLRFGTEFQMHVLRFQHQIYPSTLN